jgi:hypothetical protein
MLERTRLAEFAKDKRIPVISGDVPGCVEFLKRSALPTLSR